jgi:hypothetical protein
MSKVSTEEYADLLGKLKKANKLGDRGLTNALELYRATGNKDWKQLLLDRVEPILWHQGLMAKLDPLFLPPHELAAISEGEILIGHVIQLGKVTDIEVKIGMEDALNMLSVFGWIRKGKSSLLQVIMSGLIEQDKKNNGQD